MAGDLEAGSPAVEEQHKTSSNASFVSSLGELPGQSVGEKVDAFVETYGVVIVAKSWCPFCRDAIEFLSSEIGVEVHAINIDKVDKGNDILAYVKEKTGHRTVPVVFIKGSFVGGCDDIKKLHAKGELDTEILKGLVNRDRVTGTNKVETAQLVPVHHTKAYGALLWFPDTVNNNVVRVTGIQVCIMSAISCGFFSKTWGRYLAVGLLVDFGLRLVAGSQISPLGMIATLLTSPFTPDFRAGPPKQFAAFCGLFFSLLGTIFYFVVFPGHEYIGAAWMGMLAGAAGLEGFLDFCLGCVFFGLGIEFGLIPDQMYRIYTASRQETVESWEYLYLSSGTPPPVKVDTDPSNPIALKYKQKSDEWTKEDFDLVRNMQIGYFGMPMAIVGLSVAFKIASKWPLLFNSQLADLPLADLVDIRSIIAPEAWFETFAAIGTFFFVLMLVLYGVRLVLHPHKCWIEWDCPLRSNSFGMVTITLMLFAFLIYDKINFDQHQDLRPQMVARVFFWIGAVGHAILTVIKTGEWIGRRLELEHVHASWMIFPVGLAVAALVAPVVGVFAHDNGNSVGNALIARFFFSIAWLMWIALFTITFFKVVTTHNSDNRIRHSAWIWLAAPCVLGLAQFAICASEQFDDITPQAQCANEFANYYFIGIFFLLVFAWATLPHLAFFGREQFNMGYWTECFALDTLAACACLFYALNGYQISQTLQMIFLTIASVCNLVALLHTLTAAVRQRLIFVPEEKWGPLSFMKLTHEAFRGNMKTMEYYLNAVSLDDTSHAGKETIGLFAAHFNRFRIVHEEHARHEDLVIFKTFNDFFPKHAKKWNDDHTADHAKMVHWCKLVNQVLDVTSPKVDRQRALDVLKTELIPFFEHFKEHLLGEEDNLNPIGRKHLNLDIMKQISRDVWNITPAERWEVIVPFIVKNLPRHGQRVRYLKVLCWSMPERAQQIGAIVFRNVDSVTWQRLCKEVPEVIPRGAPGWMRYY